MSEVKVNKISPRSGTDVTLGDSGDTFTIPSGATINNQGTAVNFGATGSASWVTTVKTSTFTAVAGEGYFVNTTGGVVSVNLPAGTAGAVVAVKDYAGTFDTNAVTLVQNGSDKIGGSAINPTLNTEGVAVTLVFVDSTQGWLITDDGLQSQLTSSAFITATGGTISTVCTNFKLHTFTGPGTFTVCSVGNAAGSNTVSYAIVAGGGGGGFSGGAGAGGAGGFRESKATSDSYTASPLNATSGPGFNIPVSAQGYPIVVGGGGAGSTSNPTPGTQGVSSSAFGLTSTGGGGGGSASNRAGVAGGSGGGASGHCNPGNAGGAGNTPPVSPAQGSTGGAAPGGMSGSGCRYGGGGGGGATAVGVDSAVDPTPTITVRGGNGGAGATTSISGSPVGRAGGGGGGVQATAGNPGAVIGNGVCGGGCGGSKTVSGCAGTVNTGGGGGAGGSSPDTGSLGGSGIVLIRYKFQ